MYLISMALYKIAVSPLIMHWRYGSLKLNHRYNLSNSEDTEISTLMPVAYLSLIQMILLYVEICEKEDT